VLCADDPAADDHYIARAGSNLVGPDRIEPAAPRAYLGNWSHPRESGCPGQAVETGLRPPCVSPLSAVKTEQAGYGLF